MNQLHKRGYNCRAKLGRHGKRSELLAVFATHDKLSRLRRTVQVHYMNDALHQAPREHLFFLFLTAALVLKILERRPTI